MPVPVQISRLEDFCNAGASTSQEAGLFDEIIEERQGSAVRSEGVEGIATQLDKTKLSSRPGKLFADGDDDQDDSKIDDLFVGKVMTRVDDSLQNR